MFQDLVAKDEISESALDRHSRMEAEYKGPSLYQYLRDEARLKKRFKASFGKYCTYYVDKPF